MLKQIIGSVLIVASLAVGLAVFAQTTPNTATAIFDLACVGNAVAAREASIQTALNTYTSAMSAAYAKRASDLAAAYAGSSSALKSAVKTAWNTFNTAGKSAKKTYNTAGKSAWTKFSTERKTCKAPATGENPASDNIQ